MYRLLSSVLLVLISSLSVTAQSFQVTGIVVNVENNQPMAGASVFINNSSNGTTTNSAGEFTISNISTSSFELVISFVSFETVVVNITPENIRKRFRVQMAVKENELQEVVVGPVDKDGWRNWGRLFTEFFIGTSKNAEQCRIKNPEVLKFRYNRKTHVLRVTALDRLLIENKQLGLNISYQLEEFVNTGMMTTFYGYSSFEYMTSENERKVAGWKANRKEAYDGSIMHFMRAFYQNKTADEGFELRQLLRLYKEDSTTIELYNKIIGGDVSAYDTAKFVSQLMNGRGFGSAHPIIYIIARSSLPEDSIRIFDSVNNRVHLSFGNHVMVRYKNELEKLEFALQQYPSRRERQSQNSIINLPNLRSVTVDQQGNYYNPLDVFTEGYWGWEKMAEFLPIDYKVGE